MSDMPFARRGFLRGLASLPLIGGGVSLVGHPTAAAVPVSVELLERYAAWLAREHGHALIERDMLRASARDADPNNRAMTIRHRREWVESLPIFGIRGGDDLGPLPSTRAAVVMAAAGCPIRR